MSRKKLITYLLIILTLVMIVDVKYVRSDNNLFEGLITESIEEMIGAENNFFQYNYNQESIKAEKEGNLRLGADFLRKNEEINSFNLENEFGSIQLQGSKNQEINIDYTLKVHAEDREAAEKFIQDLEVIYNLEGSNLEISLNRSQTETPELIKVVEIDYKITVPEDLQTELINNYGKLQVQNLKAEVNGSNRYGSTRINNIDSAVVLNLAYGESRIDNLGSTLELDSSYAENTINRVAGNFKLESAYGFNKISNLESALIINSRYGGAEISSAADIEINSRYTGFKISDVEGKITADSEYGEFQLSQIEDLDLELRYADVEITSLPDYELYSYDLSTEHGNINADFAASSNENKEELNYQGQQAKYKIIINSEYGDININ
ncbi:putative adhesin [Halanaerobium saccharolyticum]|uniref:Putative adhesin n=1 Tax=Halanaerobium saccharolyticum TaxID=43595 RepID=A0A4R6M220_9FIRM|nr:DUF4097 family beta strand repeat-containing protein [Halanaerobium saccharolyticum]TDO95281.1 putative adhesin [Halanaerobium saccharolyticum]